jgi:hypothetical protein
MADEKTHIQIDAHNNNNDNNIEIIRTKGHVKESETYVHRRNKRYCLRNVSR